MESRTLEQYFLQDYEETKAENERLRERLRELEDRYYGFGITDLHRKFQAVKGSVCSKWQIKDYMLKNGKMTPERMREVMALDDEALFKKYKNKSINYYNVINYNEHEFQYTLFIKESRTEWTAVTDGSANDHLLVITPREMGDELCEDEWYPIEEADAMRSFLAQALREVMERALNEYEQEQQDKDTDNE